MIRKIIIFIASLIICLPLYATPQVLINTEIDGNLTLKRFYSSISEETDITNGEYYIDLDGVNATLGDVDNPFNIREGFVSDNFYVTFFGSLDIDQTYEIDVTNSPYYYFENSNKIYLSQYANIINKTPSNGLLTFYEGIYYDISNAPSYSFQVQSPIYETIPSGRYYTDITINIVEL